MAWVNEADAVEASVRCPRLAVRGALFGVAVQRVGEAGAPWRLVGRVQEGMPQSSRDGLHSKLWFRAKDDTDDPGVRRELLAAVAVLEREPADEIVVLGERFRVVRADEVARSGEGGLEPPRPTDPEPVFRSWEGVRAPTYPDVDFELAPGGEEGLMAEALRIGLRGFHYTGDRYPAAVRNDSRRAVATHPEIALLPVTFGVVERRGEHWHPHGTLQPTPHDARRLLHDGLAGLWAEIYGLNDTDRERNARAAQRFRAEGRADEVWVGHRLYRICRVERMIRFGPDGPEPPRPSDVDEYGPMKLHPTMHEDGSLHYGDE